MAAAHFRFLDGSTFEASDYNWTGPDDNWLIAEGRLAGYDRLNPGPTEKLEAPESSVLYVLPKGDPSDR